MSENPASRSAHNRSALGRSMGRLSRVLGGASSLAWTGRMLRRQLWLWPLVAAAGLGLTGWWVQSIVDRTVRDHLASELKTVLDADVTALDLWIEHQISYIRVVCQDQRLLPIVQRLQTVSAESPDSAGSLLQAPELEELRKRLEPYLTQGGYTGFMLFGIDRRVLGSDQDMPIGMAAQGAHLIYLQKSLEEGAAVSRPFPTVLPIRDVDGELRTQIPTMFVAGTIQDDQGKPLAVLGLRIRPADQFTRILQVARLGRTGETVAFDREGLLLSQSRYDDQLKQVGLLTDLPRSESTLSLYLRDPGADLTSGARPPAPRARWPLTHMVESARTGKESIDVHGSHDYRGVRVVGAWTWLPKQEFGVGTKLDEAEALRPLYVVRRVFWAMIGLLTLAAVGIFGFMVFASRQQQALQQAVVEAKRLGQYALEAKIGAGAMGEVYRARHAMLRRPTAIKLLNPSAVSETTLARFEREVQLTSSLSHPNTIAIFDYGRTPEGVFYYAMELLDGINLEQLVTQHGPLSDGRALYLLKQISGSLAEAHLAGLVHRDIKPANIFLTHRGGLYDFVKVLDFGLVKGIAGAQEANVTAPQAMAGTPLYLSPEAVREPDSLDARADVYAIGAVAYFLVTGRPVFDGSTVMEICLKHVSEKPVPPSERSGRPLAAELEQLILRCLAKDRAERPANALALLRELDRCTPLTPWSAADAERWWSLDAGALTVAATADATAGTTAGAGRTAAEIDQTVAFRPSQ